MEAMKAIPLELEADHVLQSEERVKSTANYLPVRMRLRKTMVVSLYDIHR